MKLLLLVVVLVVAGARTDQGLERNKDLLEWIHDLGGYVEGVSLQPILGMGLGMVAARDLEVLQVTHLVGQLLLIGALL